MFRLPHNRKSRIQLTLVAMFLGAFALAVIFVSNYLDWIAQSVDLRDAIVRGDLEAVKQFERDGADWRRLVKLDRYSALHQAAGHNHLEMVRYFVENGADVTAKTDDGMTPAGFATRHRYLDVLKFLLMETPEGESIARTDHSTIVAITFADHELMKWLLERADRDNPVAYFKCHGFMMKAARIQDAEMVAKLLSLGVSAGPDANRWHEHFYRNVTIPDSNRVGWFELASPRNYTPLHWAAVHGNEEITKLLLDHGADPSLVDADGKTPLDHANEKEFDGIARLLEAVIIPSLEESE